MAFMVVVAGPTRYVQVIWDVKKVTVSFTNSISTNRQIVVLSGYLIEDTLPPTIKVIPAWYDFHKPPAVSSATSARVLAGLTSK